MKLKDALRRSGYPYTTVFTNRANDIDFETPEDLCFALGYILKHADRIDAEIPEGRNDLLSSIVPNYPITQSCTVSGYDMKWGAQYRIYFDSTRNMPRELLNYIQNDQFRRLSGSRFVESLLYIGFNPGTIQDEDLIRAVVEEVFVDSTCRQAFEEGYRS